MYTGNSFLINDFTNKMKIFVIIFGVITLISCESVFNNSERKELLIDDLIKQKKDTSYKEVISPDYSEDIYSYRQIKIPVNDTNGVFCLWEPLYQSYAIEGFEIDNNGGYYFCAGDEKTVEISCFEKNNLLFRKEVNFSSSQLHLYEDPNGVSLGSSQIVARGESIGILASPQSRGYSNTVTPHIHLQMYNRGRRINPTSFFPNIT